MARSASLLILLAALFAACALAAGPVETYSVSQVQSSSTEVLLTLTNTGDPY